MMILFDWPLRLFLSFRRKKGGDLRRACGVFAGWVGVIVNIMLAALKFAIAAWSGSVALAVDAANNLSDAASGGVTVAGFILAGKPADEEHPFGHGRVEYIAGIIVSVIIIAVGLNFFKESMIRIFRPGEVLFDWRTAALLLPAVFFKLWLGGFFYSAGKKTDSPSLKAAAIDSFSDLGVTAIVLISMAAGKFTTFPVDGIAGVIVSVFVLLAGIKVLKEIADPLIGSKPEQDMVDELVSCLLECEGIRGVHDCIIHSYGPELYFATAHAEVDRNGDLVATHDILEHAEVAVAKKMPVTLVLHCDPFNVSEPVALYWRRQLENAANAIDERFKIYDFRYDCTPGSSPCLRFHLLVNRSDLKCKKDIIKFLEDRVKSSDPGVSIEVDFVNAYV